MRNGRMIWLSALQTGGRRRLVMEAAKQAGASGGTVVHARGFNAKEEENFLHLLIRPERNWC